MDALSTQRRMLSMVRVEQDYVFDGPAGPVHLRDLFEGRAQLIVQHFMFDPAWEQGCGSCTAAADELSPGLLDHLHARTTSFAAVSRAPIEKLERYKAERGWTFAWYSSFRSTFNLDFHVTLDATRAPVMFNYRDADELAAAGLGWILESPTEQPGYSMFWTDGDEVFHTYSTFGRGTEWLGGAYAFLDLTVLGRQEEWEQPAGRAAAPNPAVPNFAGTGGE